MNKSEKKTVGVVFIRIVNQLCRQHLNVAECNSASQDQILKTMVNGEGIDNLQKLATESLRTICGQGGSSEPFIIHL
jgi:hypothetical protein